MSWSKRWSDLMVLRQNLQKFGFISSLSGEGGLVKLTIVKVKQR